MRTTIELSERHRGFLITLAAERGSRGYSAVICDALDHYMSCKNTVRDLKAKVLKMKGSWSQAEADDVREKIAEVRAKWLTKS